ncbi:MAG: arylsulfatase [Verrucomicrobiales bacterium]
MNHCAAYLLLASLLSLSAVSAAAPPNVVFILADDLGYGELGCYGQKKIRTPNIDRLASQGLRFTRHYSGAPVCAPARCVLMTGKHLGHAQIRGNLQAKVNFPEFTKGGQHPITPEALTIAEKFQQAGYATAAMGKWGLGPVGSTGDPNKQGFDHFYGYNCQAVAHSFFPKAIWDDDQHVVINEKPIPGHKKQPQGEVKMDDYIGENYASDLIRSDALKWLGEHAGGEQPFFLYLPFTEPHVAMHPPKAMVESYPAAWDDRPYRGQCAYLPHPRPRAGYAAMITHLDQHVGAVLDLLDAKGVADDTIVIFTSDNGTTHPSGGDPVFGIGGVDAAFFNSLGGLKGYKGSVHEGGLRVPCIVRWPGRVEAGSTSDFPAYFPDWFPTLCELSGLQAPGGLDGISIAPTILGQGTQVKRPPMVWIYPEYGGQIAARFGDHLVLRTKLRNKKQLGPWEAYNVVTDPKQSDDLAADQPELIEQAKAILASEWSENPTFPMDKQRSLN